LCNGVDPVADRAARNADLLVDALDDVLKTL